MERRIALVRHGRSAHIIRPGWVDVAGVHQWREAYDAAGIHDESAPPAALIEHVARADHLIASDLARSIASAERLAPGRDFHRSPLMRETPLALPDWPRSRWPLRIWELGMYLRWRGDRRRGTLAPPDELLRASEAARWLDELSREASSIVVVTHGVFRFVLGQQLVSNGWRAQPRVGGYDNWSSWMYTSSGM